MCLKSSMDFKHILDFDYASKFGVKSNLLTISFYFFLLRITSYRFGIYIDSSKSCKAYFWQAYFLLFLLYFIMARYKLDFVAIARF